MTHKWLENLCFWFPWHSTLLLLLHLLPPSLVPRIFYIPQCSASSLQLSVPNYVFHRGSHPSSSWCRFHNLSPFWNLNTVLLQQKILVPSSIPRHLCWVKIRGDGSSGWNTCTCSGFRTNLRAKPKLKARWVFCKDLRQNQSFAL